MSDKLAYSPMARATTNVLVADALRARIVSGEIPMGRALIEQVLCEQLDISRTPLRQALTELQHEGLVEIVPYKGARVFLPTADEILELGAFRSTLEVAALREAMKRDPHALAEDLEKIVARADDALQHDGGRDYGIHDTKFHETIIAHNKNRYISDAYRTVKVKLAVFRNSLFRLFESVASEPGEYRDHVGTSAHQHERIVGYIKENKEQKCVALLKAHINGGTKFYSENIDKIINV